MDEIKKISKEALEFWGYEAQSMMLIEEMAELTKALCKYKRQGCKKAEQAVVDNLVEEIADVHNMIEQMEIYFGEDKINAIRLSKMKRTEKRMAQQKLNQ